MSEKFNNCGRSFIPTGSKYHPSGVGLRLHYDNEQLDLKLVHNQSCVIESGNKLVTSSEKCSIEENINLLGFSLYSNVDISISGSIQISIKDFTNNKLFSFTVLNQTVPTRSVFLPLDCSSGEYNLYNRKFKVDIESVCYLNTQCCDLPDFVLQPPSITIDIPCDNPEYYCIERDIDAITITTSGPTTTTSTTTAIPIPDTPIILTTGANLTPVNGTVFLEFTISSPVDYFRIYVDGSLLPNQIYQYALYFNPNTQRWELEIYEESSILLDENFIEISAVIAGVEGEKASLTLNPALSP